MRIAGQACIISMHTGRRATTSQMNNASFIHHIKDKYCLISPEQSSSVFISEAHWKMLHDNHADDVMEQVEPVASCYGLSLKRKSIHYVDTAAMPVTGAAIFVAQQCNMDCIYCYGKGGEYGAPSMMEAAVLRKSIEWLFSQSQGREVKITFFGGEPLMNFEAIRNAVEYGRKIAAEKKSAIRYSIVTNGLLLRDDIIRFLHENNFETLVSFDGPEEIQNRQRPIKGGGGSYHIVANNAARLLESLPESSCKATLLNPGDKARAITEIQRIGFKTSNIMYTLATPDHDFEDKTVQDYTPILIEESEFGNQLLAIIKKRDSDAVKKAQMKNSIVPLFFWRFLSNTKAFYPCGAGRSEVAISTNGDIYPCHRFVGNTRFRIGHVDGHTFDRSTYVYPAIHRNNACRSCFARYFCGGICYYENYAFNSDVYSPVSEKCAMIQHIVLIAAYVYASLDAADLAFLADIHFRPTNRGVDA